MGGKEIWARAHGASLILGYSASIPFIHSEEIEKGRKGEGSMNFVSSRCRLSHLNLGELKSIPAAEQCAAL